MWMCVGRGGTIRNIRVTAADCQRPLPVAARWAAIDPQLTVADHNEHAVERSVTQNASDALI